MHKKKGILTRFKIGFNNVISGIGGYYNSASVRDSFLKQWLPNIQTADQEIIYDLEILRARSRDLVRNNTIGRTAAKTISSHVIGKGLKLQSNIDRDFIQAKLNWTDADCDEWENETERRFRNWSQSNECDLSRRQNFYQLQYQAYYNKQQSGDIFAMLALKDNGRSQSRLKIKHIESDMVKNPSGDFINEKIRAGIEFGDDGDPIAYYILKNNIFGYDSFETIRVPAFGGESGRRNVIHIFDQERPGQSRGLPLLTPVMKKIKQLGRYEDSEIAAAVVTSFLSVFIKSSNPDIMDDPMNRGINQDADSDIDYTLAPGAVFRLGENESIDVVNPTRPNTGFNDFIISCLRDISMCLEIPLELFIKHFTSSFSASRAAMASFETFIMSERNNFSLQYNQPIFEEWLTEEVISGRIDAPGYLFNSEIREAFNQAMWIGNAMPQINEMVSVNAAKERINNNLSTYQAETIRLTGGDFRTNAKKLKNEKELLGIENEQNAESTNEGPMGGNSN